MVASFDPLLSQGQADVVAGDPEVVPSDLDRCRREARHHASSIAEGVKTPDPDSWPAGVATCGYGPGCLVLAISSRCDHAGIEALRAVELDLHRLASRELVIDCRGLGDCSPRLARVLSRLRIRLLTAGARVELHDPPAALRAELGAGAASSFAVENHPS